MAAFKEAVTLHPAHLPSIRMLATHHQREQRPGDAEALYRAALALHPDRPPLLWRLGFMGEATGHAAAAAELYTRALRADPGHLPALICAAHFAHSQVRLSRAPPSRAASDGSTVCGPAGRPRGLWAGRPRPARTAAARRRARGRALGERRGGLPAVRTRACSGPAERGGSSLTPYQPGTSRPSPRTNRTRRVQPQALCNLGLLLHEQFADAPLALRALRRACAISPGHPASLLNLASVLATAPPGASAGGAGTDALAEAEALFGRAVEATGGSNVAAITGLAQVRAARGAAAGGAAANDALLEAHEMIVRAQMAQMSTGGPASALLARASESLHRLAEAAAPAGLEKMVACAFAADCAQRDADAAAGGAPPAGGGAAVGSTALAEAIRLARALPAHLARRACGASPAARVALAASGLLPHDDSGAAAPGAAAAPSGEAWAAQVLSPLAEVLGAGGGSGPPPEEGVGAEELRVAALASLGAVLAQARHPHAAAVLRHALAAAPAHAPALSLYAALLEDKPPARPPAAPRAEGAAALALTQSAAGRALGLDAPLPLGLVEAPPEPAPEWALAAGAGADAGADAAADAAARGLPEPMAAAAAAAIAGLPSGRDGGAAGARARALRLHWAAASAAPAHPGVLANCGGALADASLAARGVTGGASGGAAAEALGEAAEALLIRAVMRPPACCRRPSQKLGTLWGWKEPACIKSTSQSQPPCIKSTRCGAPLGWAGDARPRRPHGARKPRRPPHGRRLRPPARPHPPLPRVRRQPLRRPRRRCVRPPRPTTPHPLLFPERRRSMGWRHLLTLQ